MYMAPLLSSTRAQSWLLQCHCLVQLACTVRTFTEHVCSVTACAVVGAVLCCAVLCCAVLCCLPHVRPAEAAWLTLQASLSIISCPPQLASESQAFSIHSFPPAEAPSIACAADLYKSCPPNLSTGKEARRMPASNLSNSVWR